MGFHDFFSVSGFVKQGLQKRSSMQRHFSDISRRAALANLFFKIAQGLLAVLSKVFWSVF